MKPGTLAGMVLVSAGVGLMTFALASLNEPRKDKQPPPVAVGIAGPFAHPANEVILVHDRHGHAFTLYPSARHVTRLPDADRPPSAINCNPKEAP